MDFKFRLGVSSDEKLKFPWDGKGPYQDLTQDELGRMISNMTLEEIQLKFSLDGKMNWKEFLVKLVSSIDVTAECETLNESLSNVSLHTNDLIDRHTLAACEDLSIDDKAEIEKIVRLGNVQFTKALLYAYKTGSYLQCVVDKKEGYEGVLNYLNNDCIASSEYRVLLEQKAKFAKYFHFDYLIFTIF